MRYPLSNLFTGAMAGVILTSMTVSLPAYAESVMYVSDQLKVPMRSGTSSQHRIIKFVSSGARLKVLDTSDDYTQVETSAGKTGWILTSDLMNVPHGRDRLAATNKKLSKIRDENESLKAKIGELRGEVKTLSRDKSSLQNERTNLSNSLEDLKITASNPIALSKKNKQLKKDLDKANANIAMLEKDNQQLRSNVMQEWFIIGGGVAIGSLIIGIILTRINWRRKRDSWGGGF